MALALAAGLPGRDHIREPKAALTNPSKAAPAAAHRVAAIEPTAPPSAARASSWPLAWRVAWDRIGEQASVPAARVRPWGRVVAIVMLGGMVVGLARLTLGLAAINLSRRRSRLVNDPALIALIDEVRQAMGGRRAVEIREVADLATAATAGWLRPVLLLPSGWRWWDPTERRAVVAHELAHVVRGDYASSLLGRFAVALHAYHPLVWWMESRLRLDQELAADAFASRFVGGRSAYLVALAGLVLKQDGRSPRWPARAFLPDRGTLIRRIAMLKQDVTTDRSRYQLVGHLITAVGLVVLTLGVASWQAPASADDEPAMVVAVAPAPATEPVLAAPYLSEKATGALSLRPATATRRPGMARFLRLLREEFGIDEDLIAREVIGAAVPPDAPKLRAEMIESVVFGFDIRPVRQPPKAPVDAPPQHRLEVHGATVRMVGPLDWPGFLRACGMKVEEVSVDGHVSYKLTSQILDKLKMPLYAFSPDERTFVIDGDPDQIQRFLRREGPAAPAYLRGGDWARVCQGVLALAIDNAGDRFVRDYDLGRPDDAMVLPFFRGVDRWVLGVADADPLTFRAEATGREPEAVKAVARAAESLIKLGQATLAAAATPADEANPDARLAVRLLASLKVEVMGGTAAVSAVGFATDADLAALLERFDPPAKNREHRRNAKPAQPPAGKP